MLLYFSFVSLHIKFWNSRMYLGYLIWFLWKYLIMQNFGFQKIVTLMLSDHSLYYNKICNKSVRITLWFPSSYYNYMLNTQCRYEETLSVVCGGRSWYLILVVAILRLKFPHVLVRVLQVVVAHFFQDLLQIHLTPKQILWYVSFSQWQTWRLLSSEMWRHAVWYKSSIVSEEPTSSIFRAE